jgi:hypothetical protein
MKWFFQVLVMMGLAACSATSGPEPSAVGGGSTIRLSPAQAQEIGKRIWRNECAGTVDGLTAWNAGEDFASLGIAHFIWYPTGTTGPFEESFPRLVAYLQKEGVAVPAWLSSAPGCPWPDRASFQRDFHSPRMVELRKLLTATVAEQARFAALRLEAALPKMLAAAPPGNREHVRTNFYRVAREPLGMYALMDYVNFKGEGISPSERYRGQGWGLLQVLETMPATGPALPAFASAADKVLTLRVKNSPPERNEQRWLAGWRNRLKTYTQ